MDNIDVRKVDPSDLRDHMALVPQDTTVFATSIMENIRFGRPDASDEDVYKAAETALARGFIEDMADGFNTSVGERGITLSVVSAKRRDSQSSFKRRASAIVR